MGSVIRKKQKNVIYTLVRYSKILYGLAVVLNTNCSELKFSVKEGQWLYIKFYSVSEQ